MEPSAEQLIRDYLNRLSVAAGTRLRSDDRLAFLARTREFIERRAGAPGTADPGAVLEALSSLGEPEAAAESEQARLVAERSKRGAARAGLWRPRSRGSAPDAEAPPDSGAASEPRPAAAPDPRPSPDPAPRAAVDVSHLTGRELKGDIEKKVKVNRPLTSRRRPGEPLKQQPSRPYRIPRPRVGVGGSRPPEVNGVGPSGSGTRGQHTDSKPRGSETTGSQPEGSQPRVPTEGSSPATALPVDWLSGAEQPGSVPPGAAAPAAASPGAASPGAAPSAAGTPEATSPGTARPGAASRGAAPSAAGTPEASSPGTARPGAASPGAGAGTTSPAARPAGGAAAPATRSARAVTSLRPRLPSARLARRPGVTRDRVRRLVSFWGRHRLEATAVILMALAGLVYPLPVWVLGFSIWLLGALLAAASKQWSLEDKWAGILGPVVLVIAGTSTGLALGGQRHSMASYAHEVLADSRYMIQIAAVLGAVYLAWRVYRGRRSRVPPWNRHHRI